MTGGMVADRFKAQDGWTALRPCWRVASFGPSVLRRVEAGADGSSQAPTTSGRCPRPGPTRARRPLLPASRSSDRRAKLASALSRPRHAVPHVFRNAPALEFVGAQVGFVAAGEQPAQIAGPGRQPCRYWRSRETPTGSLSVGRFAGALSIGPSSIDRKRAVRRIARGRYPWQRKSVHCAASAAAASVGRRRNARREARRAKRPVARERGRPVARRGAHRHARPRSAAVPCQRRSTRSALSKNDTACAAMRRCRSLRSTPTGSAQNNLATLRPTSVQPGRNE